MILDATCGYKAMWKGKNTDNVVFLDIKREVNPSVVADAKHLPFKNLIFEEIVCDPPHLIRNDLKHWSKIWLRYGHFKRRVDWLKFLICVNKEFTRCLKNDGKILFKVTDGKDRRVTKKADVINYLEWFEEVSDIKRKSPAPWSTNTTHFISFKKTSSL